VTEHLGSLISALLDGELEPGELADARAHLAACASCPGELQATARARELVRGLPQLDPPFGLIERALMRPRQRTRRVPVLIAGAAAAVAAGLFAFAPGQQPAVRPPVATFVDAHVTAASIGDPVSGLAPVALPVTFPGRP
jgi:anti-sigma factor RsiW